MGQPIITLNERRYYVAGNGYYMDYSGGYLHHQILPPKPGFVIDHANGDPLDNRPENLRYATRADNIHNSRPYASTGYKCVNIEKRYPKKPYKVQVGTNGKNYHFGRYADINEAVYVADQVMMQMHGEFARLNLPW